MSQLQIIQDSLAKLRMKGYDNLYTAGLPRYGRNFSRDSLIYGLISKDYEALKAQIDFSSDHQGTKTDPITGEEKGKIHHELPGRVMDDLRTDYNACDTTALFLLSIVYVANYEANDDVTNKYRENIQAAISYIRSHLKNDLFWEDPAFAKADRFALNVTYWKDSVLNGIENKPDYPIVYSLAHFQNASALIEIGRLLNDKDLVSQGEAMIHAGLEKLWSKDHFITAVEAGGYIIDPLSTDSLYSLFFIDNKYLSPKQTTAIENYSKALETPAGYRSGIPDDKNPSKDQYHTRYVWVYEQAVLNIAARKHHLSRAETITSRILPYLKQTFAEELDTKKNLKPAGDIVQLWSIGAAIYFLQV